MPRPAEARSSAHIRRTWARSGRSPSVAAAGAVVGSTAALMRGSRCRLATTGATGATGVSAGLGR